MPDDVLIRHFKLMPDGELEFWYASSTGHYGGACPSVGDTIGSLYPEGDDELSGVTRRYFFDEPDRESGWALILRPLASDAILQRVTEAYRREVAADREEEARQEERLALRAEEAHQRLLAEIRPRPANRRIISILRWLATRKAGKTYKQIERAGERTITLMLADGLVEPCGQDRDGLTRVRITTAGREVVRLDDEWERDAEERRQRRGW